MTSPVIDVCVDSNEQGTDRAAQLLLAIEDDARFRFGGFRSLVVDAMFEFGGKRFHVEFKEPQDYAASIMSGHLYDQLLQIRETGESGMVLVIGDDEDISNSVVRMAVGRKRRACLDTRRLIAGYEDRIRDFEANAYAMRVPVLRMKRAPFRRVMSIAHKVLTEADLLAHRPKSVEGERHVAALCMLVPGIGPVTARTLLSRFTLQELACADADELKQVEGIGDVLASRIVKSFHIQK